MRRGGNGETYLDLLEQIRRVLPGVAVRSTFITGFPGETEGEFEELCSSWPRPVWRSPASFRSTLRKERRRPACHDRCRRAA